MGNNTPYWMYPVLWLISGLVTCIALLVGVVVGIAWLCGAGRSKTPSSLNHTQRRIVLDVCRTDVWWRSIIVYRHSDLTITTGWYTLVLTWVRVVAYTNRFTVTANNTGSLLWRSHPWHAEGPIRTVIGTAEVNSGKVSFTLTDSALGTTTFVSGRFTVDKEATALRWFGWFIPRTATNHWVLTCEFDDYRIENHVTGAWVGPGWIANAIQRRLPARYGGPTMFISPVMLTFNPKPIEN